MNNTSTKHPKALYMLFFAEMWERFSYYGMRALLLLYMIRELSYGDTKSTGIYAAYGALVYATPFIGGVLADKILGYRKAVLFGALLMVVGHFIMAFEGLFFPALAFLIVGNGFFKPNISSMVGGLYKKGDERRDAGFTIFYLGINLGAFLSPIFCGFVGQIFGWHYGFTLAGIGMLIGMIVFWKGMPSLGETNGVAPDVKKLKQKHYGVALEHWVYIFSLIGTVLITYLIYHYEYAKPILVPFAILCVLILVIYSITAKSKEERERLWAIIIFTFLSTVFWAFFEQAGSSITLFTENNVDKLGIPTSIFQSVNPLFIVALGGLFSSMWMFLSKKKLEPNTPLKFALGIFQLGLGFGLFVLGAVNASESGMVGVIYLLLGYLLLTTGELFLSPVGLSMVTKLSPQKLVAMVMGVWFISSSLAHIVGGVIAEYTSTDRYMVKNVTYEPTAYGKDVHDSFTIRFIDAKKDSTQTLKINVECTSDESKFIKSNGGVNHEYTEYKSFHIDSSGHYMLKNNQIVNGLGLLNEIEVLSYDKKSMMITDSSFNLTKPVSGVLKYKMKNEQKSEIVNVVYTIDSDSNHAPVLLKKEVKVVLPQKTFFNMKGNAFDVQSYVKDLDGDPLSIKIVEAPKNGYASVGSGLMKYMSPKRTLSIYQNVFYYLMMIAFAVAVLNLLLVPILKKWMHGIR